MEEAPGTKFAKGDIVATAMGGMGRLFDGGYAEYTVVPGENVQVMDLLPHASIETILTKHLARSSRYSRAHSAYSVSDLMLCLLKAHGIQGI